MGEVIRMYEIAPIDIQIKRGWQAHRHEIKWFYCSQGSFQVNVVELDDFEKPSLSWCPKRFSYQGMRQ